MARSSKAHPSADQPKRKIALVLQGGGALGAYHVGAYEELQTQHLHGEGQCTLDWVSGISIGAFNAAIIAGNPPERRLEQLERFWDTISRPEDWTAGLHMLAPKLYNQWSYWEALTLGQPNFFSPRVPSPLLLPSSLPGPTSYYDTKPLKETLERFTDFKIINARWLKQGRLAPPDNHGLLPPRLSLGVTDVETGEMLFFENSDEGADPSEDYSNRRHVEVMSAEHVMASGSLPPGFPAQVIDGRHYWDGGCVSNTALDALLHDPTPDPILAFVIDLWSPSGPAPVTMDDVQWRQKQIQYASRTDRAVKAVAAKHALRQAAAAVGATKPLDDGNPALTYKQLDIVHIVYHPEAEQVPGSDAEFSRLSIEERRRQGRTDMRNALAEIEGMGLDLHKPFGASRESMKRDAREVVGAGVRPEGAGPLGSVRLYQVAQGKVLGERCYTGLELAKNTVPQIATALNA